MREEPSHEEVQVEQAEELVKDVASLVQLFWTTDDDDLLK